MSFHMYIPTRIIFGAKSLNELSNLELPGKKALLLISNGNAVKNNGALKRTQQQLKSIEIEYAVFDKIEANPLKETIMQGAEFAKIHNCDFIVALGGGSVLDASKAIATMISNSGDLWDYAFGKTGKAKPIANTPVPIVAITTTAGTGSEVDQWGVITNPDTNEKIGFGGIDALYPSISIIDPELMISVPQKFTAYQGFDALFHSVECYISKMSNLMSDMYALTAIENIAKYLPRAVKDGSDLKAREAVAFANTLSGVVMTISCCTSEHSMGHAMSAYHQELPHGAGLIMISKEYYSHFIKQDVCNDRFIKMAQAMGVSDAKEPIDFIKALTKLQEDCGVADLKMSDYGIASSELDNLANNARETMGGLFDADPSPLSHEQCVEIYVKSYK